MTSGTGGRKNIGLQGWRRKAKDRSEWVDVIRKGKVKLQGTS